MKWFIRRLGSATGKRFATLTVGKMIAAALQAVFFALLAQVLGLEGFGVFSVGYALTLVCMSAFEFGFGSISLRISKEAEPERIVSTMLSVRVVTNVLIISSVVLLWGLVFDAGTAIALAVAVFAVGETWANLIQNLLVGLYRERLAVAILLTRRILTLALAAAGWFAALNGAPMSYWVVGLAGAVNFMGGGLAILRQLAKPVNPIRFISSRWRYAATSIADNIKQLDVVLVGAIGGTALAGLYSAATKLVSPFVLLTSSLIQSLVPELADRQNKGVASKPLVQKAVRLTTYYAAALLVLSVVSPWALPFLYGTEFASGWPVAVGAFFVVGVSAINQCLFAWEYANGVRTSFPIAMAALNLLYLGLIALGAAGGIAWLTAAIIASAIIAHIYYRIGFARSGEEVAT